MAAAGGNNIVRFTYTGEGDIPDDVTHVDIINVRVVRARTFSEHPTIVEVICHEEVEKIETCAFYDCPSLRRVIMPGVKIVERFAFHGCIALANVECGKLGLIEEMAFYKCKSLRSIDLPSAEIVREDAFAFCKALADAQFGNELERFKYRAFNKCLSLERITIPLKDDIFATDNIFQGCWKLKHIDLIEGALHKTIAALNLEEWRNDMNQEINSINKILPNADAGGKYDYDIEEVTVGEKTQAIRTWIRSLIRKITRYKEEHQGLLNEFASTLQLALPQDTVMNNVLPFLDLPSYTFGEGDESEEEEDDSEDEGIGANL